MKNNPVRINIGHMIYLFLKIIFSNFEYVLK